MVSVSFSCCCQYMVFLHIKPGNLKLSNQKIGKAELVNAVERMLLKGTAGLK